MASTATDILRLEKQADGENTGTWGTKVNTSLDLIEDAIAGMATISTTGGSTTLSTNNYASDQARNAILKVTGTLTSNATLVIPGETKVYKVWNATAGNYTVTVKTSGGTGAVIPRDEKVDVFCDGTDVHRSSPLAGVVAYIEDQKAVTTEGGTFSAGADRTRDLNTITEDDTGIVTLASNAFTIAGATYPGDYSIEWSAPAYKVGRTQSILYDSTNTADVQRGTTEFTNASDGVQVRSFGRAVVSLTADTAYKIRHRGETSQSTNGFGVAADFGTEIYTRVLVTKVG